MPDCGCATDGCGPPNIIRRNRSNLRLKLKADGVAVADLDTALAIDFVALDHKRHTEAIHKTLPDLLIDTPETGTITVVLTSLDTDIPEGKYDISVRVTWGVTSSLEWNFVQPLVILRAVI
jgi:hypothetical protein